MATNKDFKVKNGLVAGSTITAPSITIGSDASTIAGDLTVAEGKKIYFDSTDTYIGADTDTVEDLHLGADGNISLDPDGDVIIRVGSGTEYVRFDGSTQRVGIGTTSPGIALDVRTGSQYTNTYKAHLSLIDTQTAYDGSNPGGAVIFGGLSDSSSTNSWWAKIAGEKANNTDSNRSGILNFYTREEGGNPTQRMRIKEDGQVLIGKTASVASVDRKLEVEGSIAAASGGAGGIGFHMKNSEGEFLMYTDGGALIVKDYAGSDTYPFKIEGAAQNDTLVVNTGGDVTVKDQLYIGSEIIHSGDTNNKIAFGTDTQTFTTAGSARMTIEADGDIAMTEDLDVAKHFSFDTQHVGGSAGGSTGTENGANTWCKILSWDPGTTQYRDLSLTLGITCVDVGSQNQAIIAVYGRSNGTNSAHTMGIKIMSLVSTSQLRDDSFKLITEGWGQPIELWMKKYGSYTTWNWNEIAKKVGNNSTLTYFSNSAWQSTEPVKTGGTPASARSFGTVIEGRQAVLNLYHNENVSGLSAGDVLSTISFRKHTGHAGNETIRIYNVQGDSGSSGASDDYHTSDLRISTRKIGTNAYTDRFTILGQEGYVGIGTTSPGDTLHLTGGQGYMKFGTSGSKGHVKSDYNLELYADDGGNNSSTYQNIKFFTAGSNERMRIDSAGNVGIGTTSPTGKLTVTSAGHDIIHLNRTVDNEGYGAGIIGRLGNDASTSAAHEYAAMFFQIEDHTDGAEKGSIAFHTSTGGTAADSGSTHAMQITSAGNVGIGTSSPGTPLAANAKGLVVAGTGGILDNAQDGTERIPTLVLYDTVTDYGSNTATVGEARGSIEFYSSETSNNYPGIAASIKAINESTYNSAMGLGLFTSNNLATATEKVRINADGKVGIGTTSPNQPLTVEGTMSLKEQASANADTAAYGQLWVKTATPNELYFTTDAGNDIQLTSGTSIAGGGGGAVSAVANGSNNRIATFSSADALNGEANLTFNGSTLTVTGAISATTKSFDIEHPTKEGMRLHHGSLEGPEHGVYIRGILQGDTIELPDYWTGLVDEDTITVQLTANKTFQQLYVDTVKDNKVHVKELTGRNIDCFYFVQAERKDTGRMVVEY